MLIQPVDLHFKCFCKNFIAIGIFNFKYAFKLTFNLVAHPNKQIQANSTYMPGKMC